MATRTVCFVTGGASGLGRATILRFVKRGANVILANLPSSDGENGAKCSFSSRQMYKTEMPSNGGEGGRGGRGVICSISNNLFHVYRKN